MKKKTRTSGIGKRLNIMVVIAVVTIVVITVGFSIMQFSDLNIKQAQQQAQKGVAGMSARIDAEKERALEIAAVLASDPRMVDGVARNDRPSIGQALGGQAAYIDFITVSDATGKVIYRSHDAAGFGDSVAGQQSVSSALGGKSSVLIEKDAESPLCVMAGCPVADSKGNLIGVVSTGISLENNELLDGLKEIYKTDMTIFLDNVRLATTIQNNGERVVGTELDPKIAAIVLDGKSEYLGEAAILGTQYITSYAPILASDGSAIGVLFSGQSIADFQTDSNRIITYVVGISVVAIVLIVFIVFLFVRRNVTKPIKATASFANALAAGKLDESVKIRSNDEIGQLTGVLDRDVRQAFADIEAARAVSEKKAAYQSAQVDSLLENLRRLSKGDLNCDMTVSPPDADTQDIFELYTEISNNLHESMDTIKGYINEMTYFLGNLAEGDLTQEVTSEYRGDFIALKESINQIIINLNDVFAEIIVAAEQVASGTGQVASGSQAISLGATEQSSAIEQLTASITQIASQTRQNAENAGKANEFSNIARNDAVDGNEQMKGMQQAMTQINESSVNISKIIKVIDDIAFQTNILALNAAVEAARAGIHGKGFAVVAEEVRNLAARSASAANETTALIEGSINKVNAGTKITDETAHALENIVEGVEKAVQLVGGIAVASNEQATGIAQVNRGIEQLSHVVQTNTATAQEAAAASQELSGQAELLKEKVGQFKLKTTGSSMAMRMLNR